MKLDTQQYYTFNQLLQGHHELVQCLQRGMILLHDQGKHSLGAVFKKAARWHEIQLQQLADHLSQLHLKAEAVMETASESFMELAPEFNNVLQSMKYEELLSIAKEKHNELIATYTTNLQQLDADSPTVKMLQKQLYQLQTTTETIIDQ